jgi:hypothetical protein
MSEPAKQFTDEWLSTIRMAAASGGREMFVELGRRGILPPPVPPSGVEW